MGMFLTRVSTLLINLFKMTPTEAGNENKSPSVEQNSVREESSGCSSTSNTPSFEVNSGGGGGGGSSGSMSGVVRRVKKGNLKSSNKVSTKAILPFSSCHKQHHR